jgi:hypothetical protein
VIAHHRSQQTPSASSRIWTSLRHLYSLHFFPETIVATKVVLGTRAERLLFSQQAPLYT